MRVFHIASLIQLAKAFQVDRDGTEGPLRAEVSADGSVANPKVWEEWGAIGLQLGAHSIAANTTNSSAASTGNSSSASSTTSNASSANASASNSTSSNGRVAVAAAAPSGPSDQQPALTTDGGVSVANKASSSEVIRLEEGMELCLMNDTLADCWESFGSYGARHLAQLDWNVMVDLGQLRPDWMANQAVQSQGLFDLTLPGTHNSGMYPLPGGPTSNYGIISQSLNVSQQLHMGVRYLDMAVAWDGVKAVMSNGRYQGTPSLRAVLQDVLQFLQEYDQEVVVLGLRKDPDPGAANGVAPLITEEFDTLRVPGEMIHDNVFGELGGLVATYATLQFLPAGSDKANPVVADLVRAGTRVVYFWEGQQVFCKDIASCSATPGWTKPAIGSSLIYGIPGGGAALLPSCLFRTSDVNKAVLPELLVGKAKLQTALIDDNLTLAKLRPPPCLFANGSSFAGQVPSSVSALSPGVTPVLYSLDMTLTRPDAEKASQTQLMRNDKAPYVRGEAFTISSEAERINFLDLSWLMQPGNSEFYMLPNFISFEFPVPILIHRIVEVNQEQKDCGWAIRCLASGSCWANTLLGTDGNCMSEQAALLLIEAQQYGSSLRRVLQAIGWTMLALSLLCCAGLCLVPLYRHRAKAAEEAQAPLVQAAATTGQPSEATPTTAAAPTQAPASLAAPAPAATAPGASADPTSAPADPGS